MQPSSTVSPQGVSMLNIVILQGDPQVARKLQASLQAHFDLIHIVPSIGQLRDAVPTYRAQAVILDREAASLPEIEQLRRDFPGLCLVCTHRLADEEMWTETVGAGASDLCREGDFPSIVSATMRRTRAAI